MSMKNFKQPMTTPRRFAKSELHEKEDVDYPGSARASSVQPRSKAQVNTNILNKMANNSAEKRGG